MGQIFEEKTIKIYLHFVVDILSEYGVSWRELR